MNLFIKTIIFWTLSFFCFMLTAEQKDSASPTVSAKAQSQAVSQPKQEVQTTANPVPAAPSVKQAPVKNQPTTQEKKEAQATANSVPAAPSVKQAPVKNQPTTQEKKEAQATAHPAPAAPSVKQAPVKNQPTTQTKQSVQPVSNPNVNQKHRGKTETLKEAQDKGDNLLKEKVEREPSSENLSRGRFLEIGLEYPLNFGLHLKYLLNDSIYARFGFGFMPGFFLDSFENLSPSFGWLNEEEAKLIADTFENSMYLDFRLAWSPYLKESGGGPYLEIGLSRILYGKGELQGSHLKKVIESNSFELKNYSAKTNTYNVTAHIGYQIPLEKLKLNIEVGLIKILFANVLSKSSLGYELLSEKQEEGFKNFLREKGWIFPTVSGWLSFSF